MKRTLHLLTRDEAYRKLIQGLQASVIEVGEALKCYDNIRFSFMPTIMEGSVPKYTYKLQPGITKDRQGMMIIRNEKILEILENSAG